MPLSARQRSVTSSPEQANLFTGGFEVDEPRKESALQRLVVKTVRPLLRSDVLMRHITAGGMDARTGAKLKQMGRLAGCADLEFMWLDGHALRVLFMELKLPGRKLADSQLCFRDKVACLGPYCLVTTLEEALAALAFYGLLSDSNPEIRA